MTQRRLSIMTAKMLTASSVFVNGKLRVDYAGGCAYLDEQISFSAQNTEGWDLSAAAETVGGNARGYYNLRAAEYEGKNALLASEYLHGEGGTADCVGTAQFLITWREDGTPEVVKWWIDALD